MEKHEILERLDMLIPVFKKTGFVLYTCQMLESTLGEVLCQFEKLGVVGLDSSKLLLVFENADKKTAGHLIKILKQRVSFSKRIEIKLQEGLEARNIIVHRVLRDNIHLVKDVETR